MATNRDIVATRKLDKNNKARLGRGGDTEIRNVDGRESHVNALEAYLIDVDGKAGEEFTKRVGSGEINPFTGMPEYQTKKTYEEIRGMDSDQWISYLASWGISGDEQKYIDDPRKGQAAGVSEEYFAGQQRDITMDRAGTTRDLEQQQLLATKGLTAEQLGLERTFAEEGLAQSKEFAMEGAGAQYQTQLTGLSGQLASGQRGIGRNIAQARAGAESAAGRSGLARGSATAGFESQKADLMGAGRDVTKQYQSGRAQATRGLGMQQRQTEATYKLGMEQTAATQALGMKKAQSAFDIGTAASEADYQHTTDVADLGYKQDMYAAGKLGEARMDEFYGLMGQFGGEANAWIDSEGKKHMPTGEVYNNVDGEWVLEGSTADV